MRILNLLKTFLCRCIFTEEEGGEEEEIGLMQQMLNALVGMQLRDMNAVWFLPINSSFHIWVARWTQI